MNKRKSSPLAQRNHRPKQASNGLRKNQTTWADPTIPVSKVSKRMKTKLNKNQMKKSSCWWFG